MAKKRTKGLKADYRGATPEQVALAVLRYRPDAAKKPKPARPTTR